MNDQIKETIDVIGGLILNYELADKEIQDITERKSYKEKHSKDIAFGLKILSIATGTVYSWSRRELEDGTLLSQICRKEGNDYVAVTRNFAVDIKNQPISKLGGLMD